MNFFYQSLAAAAGLSHVSSGMKINLEVDLILAHAGTGGKLIQAWEKAGRRKVFNAQGHAVGNHSHGDGRDGPGSIDEHGRWDGPLRGLDRKDVDGLHRHPGCRFLVRPGVGLCEHNGSDSAGLSSHGQTPVAAGGRHGLDGPAFIHHRLRVCSGPEPPVHHWGGLHRELPAHSGQYETLSQHAYLGIVDVRRGCGGLLAGLHGPWASLNPDVLKKQTARSWAVCS